jgi:O-antigen/teichoic acid export membrane protein
MFDRYFIFKNSNYFKNFSLLAGSEFVTQVISIIVLPILTRIYTPIEFGEYEVFKSTALILIVIGFMQYDVSIYTSKTEIECVNAWFLCVVILISICIFAFIGIYFFNIFFNVLEPKVKWLWALPIYVFFSGMTNLLLVWLTKHGSYLLLSKIKILVSLLVAATQIGFGYLNIGFLGLLYSTLIVQIIAFLIYFTPFIKTQYRNFKYINLFSIKSLLKDNWRLPFLVLPGNFLNNLIQSLPVYFLGWIDSNVLGYFSLARRIIDFPLKSINSAVHRLYVKELTDEIIASGVGIKTFSKNLKLYSLISLVLFVMVLIFTKPILPLIFGELWIPAVPYIIILGFLFCVRFVFGGLSFIMILGKAPKLDLIWQIFFGSLVSFVFYVGIYYDFSVINIIIMYVIMGVFSYLFYGYLCNKISYSKYYLSN